MTQKHTAMTLGIHKAMTLEIHKAMTRGSMAVTLGAHEAMMWGSMRPLDLGHPVLAESRCPLPRLQMQCVGKS